MENSEVTKLITPEKINEITKSVDLSKSSESVESEKKKNNKLGIYIILIFAVLIVLLVIGVLIWYMVFRPKGDEPDPDPEPIPDETVVCYDGQKIDITSPPKFVSVVPGSSCDSNICSTISCLYTSSDQLSYNDRYPVIYRRNTSQGKDPIVYQPTSRNLVNILVVNNCNVDIDLRLDTFISTNCKTSGYYYQQLRTLFPANSSTTMKETSQVGIKNQAFSNQVGLWVLDNYNGYRNDGNQSFQLLAIDGRKNYVTMTFNEFLDVSTNLKFVTGIISYC